MTRSLLMAVLAFGLVMSATGANADWNKMHKVDVDKYTYEQRDDLENALDTEFSQIDKKVDKLTTAHPMETRAPNAQELIQDVEAKRTAAMEAFDMLKQSETQQLWEESRTNVKNTMGELRDSLKEAYDELKPPKK